MPSDVLVVMASKLQSKDDLYGYWQTLPLIKIVEPERIAIAGENPIRLAMLDIFRKGILDENKDRRRYVLNISEIADVINSEEQEFMGVDKVKTTALYHHRDVLLEYELIVEVAEILEGKRYQRYYGRTAKAFIVDHHEEKKLDKYVEFIRSCILALNPMEDTAKIDTFLSQMMDNREKVHFDILDWLEAHETLFNEHDLDPIQLYGLLVELHPLYNETSQMKKLREYFQL